MRRLPRKCAARKVKPKVETSALLVSTDIASLLGEIDKLDCAPVEKFLLQSLVSNIQLINNYCTEQNKHLSGLTLADVMAIVRPGKQLESEISRRLQAA